MGRSIRIQASFIHPNVSALATDAGVITKRSACEKTSAGRAGSPLPAAIANPRVRIDRDGAYGVTRPTTTPSQRVAGPTEEDQTRIARIDANSLERHLSPLMLSRGEGENLSLACAVRRVNFLI